MGAEVRFGPKFMFYKHTSKEKYNIKWECSFLVQLVAEQDSDSTVCRLECLSLHFWSMLVLNHFFFQNSALVVLVDEEILWGFFEGW